MKLRNIPAVLVAAVLVLTALASTASATTLEVGGVVKNEAVTIKASLKSGTSTLLSDTAGFFLNTCTGSTVEGKTSTFTGATVSGPVSSLTFKPCHAEPVVVHAAGSLSVEHIAGTTNGTVRSIGAKVTVPTTGFGTLLCVTAAAPGTDIGTITGVASTASHATMDVNAALNCGIVTAKWTGTYTVTSPTGLGVAA